MSKQTIDQTLATIKTMQIQYRNGYFISDDDYREFMRAIKNINNLYQDVTKYFVKEVK